MAAAFDADPTWAADQRGRTAVVTGANSGIGLQTARLLAGLGARVVLACRNADAARAARADIARDLPAAELEITALDLADLAAVRACVADVGERFGALDLVIANAGVMAPKRVLTVDGFEMDFGTSFLGHFALIGLLRPQLSATARVVTVGSLAARAGRIDFDDLPMERGFTVSRAYARAKFAELLFAFELDRRLRLAGSPVLSLAAHPGASRTGVLRDQNRVLQWAYTADSLRWLTDRFISEAAAGAAPTVRAATDTEARGGTYYGPSGPFGFAGRPVPVAIPARLRDPVLAARLWDLAEDLTGVRFGLAA